jgi:hypothetical protein
MIKLNEKIKYSKFIDDTPINLLEAPNYIFFEFFSFVKKEHKKGLAETELIKLLFIENKKRTQKIKQPMHEKCTSIQLSDF